MIPFTDLLSVLLTSLIISLFCCGLTVTTRKNMLLYFLRRPFDKLEDLMALKKIKQEQGIIHSFKLTFEVCVTQACETIGTIDVELFRVARTLTARKTTRRTGSSYWHEKFEADFNFGMYQEGDGELSINVPENLSCQVSDVVLVQTYAEPFDWNWLLYIAKPLIRCNTCMASFWGTVVFILCHGVNIALWPYWIISCVGAAALNYIASVRLLSE